MIGQRVTADGKTPSGATWKLKAGVTTYWNCHPADIVLPIIDSESPVLTELPGAIITPREIAPKLDRSEGDRLRHAVGAVYNRERNILPVFVEREIFEASANKGNRLVNPSTLSDCDLVDAQMMQGTFLYLGILRGHFGHFLLESLSRMWSLLRSDPNIKIIVHGNEQPDGLPSFVKHVFKLLNLDTRRIITASRTLIVEHLLFPQSEFEIRWKGSTSYADLFRELFERNAQLFPLHRPPARLYLTRRRLRIKKDTQRRKALRNERAVEKIFEKRGFEIVAPETLPFHEQISLIGGARRVAGLKGSALHMNLFNQHPNARLIQLSHKQSINQCIIDALKETDSHHIFCQSSSNTEGGSVVDIDILRSALREI